MCGRFTLRTPAYKLAEAFGIEVRANLAARYNIAPSQDIAALRVDGENQRELVMLRWGLVPAWAKDPAMGNRMINARAETVAEKPAFRAAFRQRRCLIPADGFFEWQKTPDGSKQPYLMARPDGEPFTMAGLWERWQPPGTDEPLETCTIITTEANETLAPVHHRMPVIVAPGDRDAWLDPAAPSTETLTALLRPAPDEDLTANAVDRHVNNSRHDDPRCIEPASNGMLL